jgi:Cohesin domain
MNPRTGKWIFVSVSFALALYGLHQIAFERDLTISTDADRPPAAPITSHANLPKAQFIAARASSVESPSANLGMTPTHSLRTPASVRVGEHITVSVDAESKSVPMATLSFVLRYDSGKMRFVLVTAGDVMMQGGELATLSYESLSERSEIRVKLTAENGNGVIGGGSVASIEFEAIGEGYGAIVLTEFDLFDDKGHDVRVAYVPAKTVSIAAR